MIDIHISLQESLHEELAAAARREGASKTHLVREAIRQYLANQGRRDKLERMRDYAERMAPHSGEFVEGTGEMVSETVLRETEW